MCIVAAWGETREEASYILTDTGGMKIPDELVIDQADCTDHTLPSTLEAYLQVTKMTYHCRPKFQVLKRPWTSGMYFFVHIVNKKPCQSASEFKCFFLLP